MCEIDAQLERNHDKGCRGNFEIRLWGVGRDMRWREEGAVGAVVEKIQGVSQHEHCSVLVCKLRAS